ncbi:hsp70 nucleotide exchange factor FES1 isoform X2 [Cinnamomum micranthum f. kanehirae]|uniref:Hsp70 nucleotide exchange factor FES1 isoform X2 n=1 Tax=Cinnamomum micranthum f. kanehirae TaxID=337451 RepID=A0A443N748_9MAGN|nr:hsp70 nucleotide exchange factor FES1 isoform X2 [Cinnamomum micranthum f. kanehirae]
MAKARIASMSISVLLLLASSAVVADIAKNKSSSGGVFWATAKDESELVTKADAEEHDEFEGGFSSLDGMLQWAIGHSDPTKLKEAADDVQRLSANELSKRQVEIKEFMEKLKMPSDAELMLIAIADLNNSSISLEDRLRALNELLILVEPIDNANDLNKLGGLVAIIRELNNSEPEIRTASAWILGKASQNNPLVQNQVLELGVLSKLLNMVKSNFTEEAIKALYAVSAVIRNNAHGQELFFAEAGDLMLQDIMSNSSADVRLRRKSVFLVADLAECQPESSTNRAELPFFSNRLFLKSVVDLMASNDLDLQEKSLLAIRSLLQLASTEALVFKEFCGLDEALERMREQLEGLTEEEFQRDYARDMEILRREVKSIFHRKLEKVPT